MSPLVWYIHGANSTPLAFAYIKSRLPEHDMVDVAYGHDQSIAELIDALVESVDVEERPVNIIGHSLGGVIGAAVAQKSTNVRKLVTLAAPFGGSKAAGVLRWAVASNLLDDIQPHSSVVSGLRQRSLTTPTISFVTTAGYPLVFFNEPNDGVVTVQSQMALKGPQYIEKQVNHFEVLLDPTVVDQINAFIF